VAVSAFDLFKIGIGPSSSHTVGPMPSAARFAHRLERLGQVDRTDLVRAQLYGSLGATGRGHGTGMGVVLGPHVQGDEPGRLALNVIEC
jgi:L-serine dehydratase